MKAITLILLFSFVILSCANSSSSSSSSNNKNASDNPKKTNPKKEKIEQSKPKKDEQKAPSEAELKKIIKETIKEAIKENMPKEAPKKAVEAVETDKKGTIEKDKPNKQNKPKLKEENLISISQSELDQINETIKKAYLEKKPWTNTPTAICLHLAVGNDPYGEDNQTLTDEERSILKIKTRQRRLSIKKKGTYRPYRRIAVIMDGFADDSVGGLKYVFMLERVKEAGEKQWRVTSRKHGYRCNRGPKERMEGYSGQLCP